MIKQNRFIRLYGGRRYGDVVLEAGDHPITPVDPIPEELRSAVGAVSASTREAYGVTQAWSGQRFEPRSSMPEAIRSSL